MISVVIPLYNKEKHIETAIQSILSQTYQDFEIVIVNDGSTDGSVEEASKIQDSRIRIIQQDNAGVAAARNKGIKEANGKHIAFLDADDEWDTDYLSTQVDLVLRYPEANVFATNYVLKNSLGEETPTIIREVRFPDECGILENYFEVAANSHPPIWTSAVIVRKDAILSIGGFPVGIKSGEDLLTWARLAARFKIAYCRKPLAKFNVEGYEVCEKPKRIPTEDDFVGRELLKIKKEFHPAHIDDYISHWHKMRSSVYMRLGMRWKSIREALTGLRYQPSNYKLLAYCAINLLPRKFQPF